LESHIYSLIFLKGEAVLYKTDTKMKKNIFILIVVSLLACKKNSKEVILKQNNPLVAERLKPCEDSHSSYKEALQNPDQVCDLFLTNRNKLPEEISEFTNLQHLTLYNCNIDSFPKNFADKSDLKTLSISGTSILPSQIFLLKKLEELIIVKTNIPNLEDKICNISGLSTLLLIESIETADSLSKCIGNFNHLKILHIGMSSIAKLPEEFKKLTQLEELVITNTRLKTIQYYLSEMKNLKKLHLEGNKLSAKEISFLKEKYKGIDLFIKQK